MSMVSPLFMEHSVIRMGWGMSPILPFLVRDLSAHLICGSLGLRWVHKPNSTSDGSAAFYTARGCDQQTDRQTHTCHFTSVTTACIYACGVYAICTWLFMTALRHCTPTWMSSLMSPKCSFAWNDFERCGNVARLSDVDRCSKLLADFGPSALPNDSLLLKDHTHTQMWQQKKTKYETNKQYFK